MLVSIYRKMWVADGRVEPYLTFFLNSVFLAVISASSLSIQYCLLRSCCASFVILGGGMINRVGVFTD
ncbi:hypothetical protein B0T26DRAFT_703626 [Lasiosphaeria miniovina]|uniref:Uncharacterized protein n=1 Tax=Lasiosphaeria miniovina TaxID=1954250 RepID=A0AA40AVC1_9PEZI|nr:uncharacterized protein B0T26DRAFT_703626 [Lasiosphaeria miniovina]KAK0722702.1 hypothetical protein B0T26DRAFT_703626 [Lasiosphaeria miniovina]